MKRLLTVIAAIALISASAAAQSLRFSTLLGDNMVLQQNASARIWGYSDPGATITLTATWTDTSVQTRADASGHWEAFVETPAASFAPQALTATTPTESITASNILIGEVWICSGQSNMEMTLGGGFGTPVEHSLEEIAFSAQYKGVRHITVSKATALEPAYDASGQWKTANPADAPRFSAVAWFFASRLSKALDIPVGVINASWGGAMISPWMSKESLAQYPKVNLADATDDSVNAMFKPFVMYNGMFKPVSKYTSNGIIWYQGESNVSTRAEDYASMLETMARTWRADIGRGDVPFLIVELPPYDYEDGQYGLQDETGPRLREQQYLASKAIPNAGIVGTNDLAYPYELKQVHPSRKLEIGQRLCYMAMQLAYGYDNLGALNPCFKSATVNGRTVRVTFDNARSGFLGSTTSYITVNGIPVSSSATISGLPAGSSAIPGSPVSAGSSSAVTGFELAGESGHFHPATAAVGFSFFEGAYVDLTSPEVPEPKFVRYCYRDFQLGSLLSSTGLPLLPFSTPL